MKTIRLLDDHNISYQTEGHKHCRPGWVNMSCPFCTGNPGLHLGIRMDGKMATCWRCGWHPVRKVLSKLIGITEPQASRLMKEYGGAPISSKAEEAKVKIRAKAHKLPSDTKRMKARHKRYLESRNFDPDRIEKNWKLLGTGPISKLDDISYKHRILAPIFWDGERVSFQTRDITEKHPAKYMACPEDRELIKHKHILYGRQELWEPTGICVEGITDVWRMGRYSFGTFGIKFTFRQIKQIAYYFDRVLILFDSEKQAQKQAEILKAELEFRNLEAVIIPIEEDPGSLSDAQAKQLVKKIY